MPIFFFAPKFKNFMIFYDFMPSRTPVSIVPEPSRVHFPCTSQLMTFKRQLIVLMAHAL